MVFDWIRNMWTRNTADPLARAFFEKYNLNLLAIPRETVQLGDVYAEGQSRHLSNVGNIVNLITPKFELPTSISNEQMADVQDTLSQKISSNFAFDFLENFLNKLIGGSVGIGVKAKLSTSNTKFVQFSFPSLTRDYIDPFALGGRLGDSAAGYKINESNLSFNPRTKYYIVSGVVKSPSIGIITKGDNNQEINVDADIQQIVDASGQVSIQKSNDGKITFNGEKKLVIGVQLFELKLDGQNKTFRLDPIKVPYFVQGDPIERMKEELNPSFIGDAKEGSMFIDLE